MRRPDEQAAINLVFQALIEEGKVPNEDSSIDDNPDCVFEIETSRIAADCTNINLEALIQWSNSTKRLEPGKQYEIRFAIEPHYWARNSILDKQPKICSYRANGKANEVWLIIHALEDPEHFDCDDSTIAIMTDAVRNIQPDFDEIWFVHKDYRPTRIWRIGDPKVAEFPRWDTSESEYPFEGIIQFKSTITSTGLNETVTFGGAFEEIVLDPLDPNWQH